MGLAPEPVLLLNGIYLRRQSPRARLSILRSLEHTLARPLGIGTIGIAAKHGGTGPLPSRYALEARTVTRLRALRSPGGALETAI